MQNKRLQTIYYTREISIWNKTFSLCFFSKRYTICWLNGQRVFRSKSELIFIIHVRLYLKDLKWPLNKIYRVSKNLNLCLYKVLYLLAVYLTFDLTREGMNFEWGFSTARIHPRTVRHRNFEVGRKCYFSSATYNIRNIFLEKSS